MGEGMANLTKRDSEILDYIKSYMKEKGTTPTIREICSGIGLYSTNTVHGHFQRLVDLGYITKNKHSYAVKGMKYVEEET